LTRVPLPGRVIARAALAACLLPLATSAPAPAQNVTACTATPCEPYEPLGWEGSFRSQRVELESLRTGAKLAGTVFAPPATRSRRRAHPLVVLVPGSGGLSREEHLHWSARELAANGYVVVGVDPQGVGRSDTFGATPCEPERTLAEPEYPYPCRGAPFQQRENFNDAALSGVAWGVTGDNPFGRLVRRDRIGAAGHSLGAGAAVTAQARDRRVDAIVAWDGLDGKEFATDTNAPTHHAVNGHVPADGQLDRDNPVRAPALGLHSDHETTSPYDQHPQKRLRGWLHWREAGVPSAIFVPRGITHGDYGQTDGAASEQEHLRLLQWYTRAWFDLYLKRDAGAYTRLLATNPLGTPRSDAMSTQFASAVFLPARGIDCADLREACGETVAP
jgi:dienelactone hydrolase